MEELGSRGGVASGSPGIESSGGWELGVSAWGLGWGCLCTGTERLGLLA